MIDTNKPLRIYDKTGACPDVKIKKVLFSGEQVCVIQSVNGYELVFDLLLGDMLSEAFEDYEVKNV